MFWTAGLVKLCGAIRRQESLTFKKRVHSRALDNSFYLGMKQQDISDEEGTVPVLPYRPCADSDGDVLPVQELSHLGGAEVAGVKYQ